MSFLGFNVGTDLSVSITNLSTGQNVVLDGRRTSFEEQPTDKLLTSEPIDNGGRVEHRTIPNGWSGSIEVDRKSADFESLHAALEAAYYQGAAPTYFTIQVVKPAADGSSTAVFQHKGVQFHGYKPGTWSRDSIVKARIEFASSERVEIQ